MKTSNSKAWEVKGVAPMLEKLKLFKGCIESGIMPRVNSPCHRILIEIIRANKHLRSNDRNTTKKGKK